jgi:hypothetical protein
VLALINPAGKVYKTLHMSSGKPSTPTVMGTFHFYMKEPGTNAKGMLDSNYFIRGYAIHGYPRCPPTRPATAACGSRTRTRRSSSAGSTSGTGSTFTGRR